MMSVSSLCFIPGKIRFKVIVLMGCVLISSLSMQAAAQGRQRPRHPYDSQRGVGRETIPDLGQTRPRYQLGDLSELIEVLHIDEANRPVIEMVLTDYQDQYRKESDAYRAIISGLSPDSRDSEELEAQKQAAQAQLKSIREEITQRYRNGEWDDDHAKMREVLSEATKEIQDQMVEMEKAKLKAKDWSSYFAQYSEAFEAWNARQAELTLELESQLRAFLESEQKSYWQLAMAENWMRRELPKGELGGESIDLEKLLRARVLDDEVRERASESIIQWKLEIGELLAARAMKFDNVIRGYIAAGSAESADAWMNIAMQEVLQRQIVRDANLSALYLVAEALGPDHGPKFQEAVLTQVYPTVFARGQVLRGIDEAIASRPPLDEAQLESVKELRLDAADWMLAYAYRSQGEFQRQDEARLASRRQNSAEQIFQDFPAKQNGQWSTASQENLQELTEWEATMLDNLRAIIGDARFTRLSVGRKSPVRDNGGSRGRGKRGR